MGFSESQAKIAINKSENSSIEKAMDWILLNTSLENQSDHLCYGQSSYTYGYKQISETDRLAQVKRLKELRDINLEISERKKVENQKLDSKIEHITDHESEVVINKYREKKIEEVLELSCDKDIVVTVNADMATTTDPEKLSTTQNI